MATLVHPSLTNCQALPYSPRFGATPQPGWFARLAATLRRGSARRASDRNWHGSASANCATCACRRPMSGTKSGQPFWRVTRAVLTQAHQRNTEEESSMNAYIDAMAGPASMPCRMSRRR